MLKLKDEGAVLVSHLDEERVRSAIERLLSSYVPPPDSELRDSSRSPFFAPVSLLVDGDAFTRYSAFAHDISPLGIGMLHVMPLPPGEVIVVICRPNAGTLSLRTQILWCKSYGEVWYRSGGRFLEAIEA
jgi:hypothetical protein